MSAHAAARGRDKREDPPLPPKTPEEIERVRAKRLEFKLQNAEFKRGQEKTKPVEDMTPERAAFLRAVLALPDRGTPTEEERQYRRKTETLLEASK